MTNVMAGRLVFRENLTHSYPDIYTSEAISALEALAPYNTERLRLMSERIARRLERARGLTHIEFLDPDALIPGTNLTVRDARDGKFEGSEIPTDLQRQWIQGTGPATKPRSSVESGLRNVAYALLSGADGWMFDGEDALGQVDTMSLDNQRNLKLAISMDPLFLDIAAQVAAEMNGWARDSSAVRSSKTGESSSALQPAFSGRAACIWTTGTFAKAMVQAFPLRSQTWCCMS